MDSESSEFPNDCVLTEEHGEIQVITLNRPRVCNALNLDMLRSLRAVFAACSRNPSVRVVILTGAGNKAFCAGADLKERLDQSEQDIRTYNRIMDKFSFIENLNKPVIAAVNGVAYGGGTEIALAADIRIASRSAMLGLIETRLAIIPGAGGTQRLPRLVGPGRAKELIFTGRRITATKARAIGLVNRVCEPASLMAECFQLAAEIARNNSYALEKAKDAMNRGGAVDLKKGFEIETEAYFETIANPERIAALRVFQKRHASCKCGTPKEKDAVLKNSRP